MWITPENVALVTVWLGIAYLVILPFFFMAVSLLMPKKVLQRYFCEPYFSRTEQWVFTATPFSFMRMVSMAGAIAFPRLGRKRRITDIREHCPNWYVRLSQMFFYWCFGHAGVFALLLVGLLIYGWLTL